MKHSEKIGEITKALILVQQEVEPIKKDSVNPHFKNSYASLDAIIEKVLPILSKHGIALVQGGSENERGVAVNTMLMHTSGEWVESEFVLPLEKATAQSAGSAISYGRRYGVASILALTMEDDDGEAAVRLQSVQGAMGRAPSEGWKGVEKSVGAVASPAVACPVCHSDMYDNRFTKKNPKQPDYKCKDPKCNGVIWPPRGGAQAQTQQTTQAVKSQLGGGPGMQEWTPPDDEQFP